MKRILILASTVFLLTLSNCRQDFQEIDDNPNGTNKPLTYGIFNSANRELMFRTRDEWGAGRLALPWVQYSAQRNYTEEDRYQYRLTTSGDRLWTDLYSVATDYKKIIELNTDPLTAKQMSVYGPNNNQIAASRVMLAYVFSLLTDSYGDVPYYSYGNSDPDFQALNVENNVSPKFATQQKIYTDILDELSKASDMITVNDKVFTQGDVLFGNGEKLKKFANSLRLRMATRVKLVVPTANAHITDAIADGVMTSNKDNVGVPFENNLVNSSPLYSAHISRQDFRISKTFVDLLKGTRTTFSGIVDPRLFKFAAPAFSDSSLGTTITQVRSESSPESTDPNDFLGMPYGITNAMTSSQISPEKPNRQNANYFGKDVVKKAYTEYIMEYSEVAFLLSEQNNWDQTNYENGIRASMQKWGVPDASIATYIASVPAATKENVLTQKYIALFMQPFEAWAEYRRTGFPNTLLLPGQTYALNFPYKDDKNVTHNTYVFESLIAGLTDLPSRLYYPTTAQTLNRVNYQAAVSSIGGNGDKMNTKLIWDN